MCGEKKVNPEEKKTRTEQKSQKQATILTESSDKTRIE